MASAGSTTSTSSSLSAMLTAPTPPLPARNMRAAVNVFDSDEYRSGAPATTYTTEPNAATNNRARRAMVVRKVQRLFREFLREFDPLPLRRELLIRLPVRPGVL